MYEVTNLRLEYAQQHMVANAVSNAYGSQFQSITFFDRNDRRDTVKKQDGLITLEDGRTLYFQMKFTDARQKQSKWRYINISCNHLECGQHSYRHAKIDGFVFIVGDMVLNDAGGLRLDADVLMMNKDSFFDAYDSGELQLRIRDDRNTPRFRLQGTPEPTTESPRNCYVGVYIESLRDWLRDNDYPCVHYDMVGGHIVDVL